MISEKVDLFMDHAHHLWSSLLYSTIVLYNIKKRCHSFICEINKFNEENKGGEDDGTKVSNPKDF